jgi:tetratricopeptide (TPR) repeat protein
VHDLEIMPDNFYLVNNVGVELYRVGKVSEAFKYFKRSTEIFPEWATSWVNLGAAYHSLGQPLEAERCFKQSVLNGATALGYQSYAQILFELGKIDELKNFLNQRGLVVFPENPILLGINARIQ